MVHSTVCWTQVQLPYKTFIPNVWGKSGGVVTVAGGRMGDVSWGVAGGDGYWGNAVGNSGGVTCAGTDDRGLDEVGVTWEGCEYDGWTGTSTVCLIVGPKLIVYSQSVSTIQCLIICGRYFYLVHRCWVSMLPVRYENTWCGRVRVCGHSGRLWAGRCLGRSWVTGDGGRVRKRTWGDNMHTRITKEVCLTTSHDSVLHNFTNPCLDGQLTAEWVPSAQIGEEGWCWSQAGCWRLMYHRPFQFPPPRSTLSPEHWPIDLLPHFDSWEHL